MDSNDNFLISDTVQARTEQQQATPPDILSSQDNKTEQEIRNKKTEGKIVSAGSSLVSEDESTNATDNERELDAKSSADSLPPTVTAKGNEAPCLGKEVEASSESSSPHTSPENICDGSMVERQASKCVVSSQPPFTSAEAVEREGKQNVATSAQTVPATCVMQSREAGGEKMEPCIEPASSPWGDAVKMVDSLRVLAEKNIDIAWTQAVTTSDSSESKESSLKALACQERVTPEGRSAAHCIEGTDVNNKDETSVTTGSEPSVLRADSGDISGSENRETQTEDTALSTREPEAEGNGEENGRKAFFYISSCSVPGMGEGSEWPSVTGGYQMPRRPDRRTVRQESEEAHRCLGTQRCHYIVVAIALMTALIGCITYHLSDSGIGPEVLRPIGASTAFLSFAVCVFSGVYINYLNDHTQLPILPNYELLGDVDSVMAMNRASNPEFYFNEDGHFVSRTADSDYHFRAIQSADIIDKRGYGRHSTGNLQTEVKRCSDLSGTSYSAQPQKKFKGESIASAGNASEPAPGTSADGLIAMRQPISQDKVEDNDGTSQHSLPASVELPPDSQSSHEDHESETRPLLAENEG